MAGVRFFGRRGSAPKISSDLVFAVGDSHGRLDRLIALRKAIIAEAARRGAAYPKIVYLGDYIDRGPDSKGVMDLVLSETPGFMTIPLPGNHESMMRASLQPGPDALKISSHWYGHGGEQTLDSYGVHAFKTPTEMRRKLRENMPEAHQAFIDNRPGSIYEDEDNIFVHAGLDPTLSLARQDPEAVLWIGKEFLESEKDWGKLVVHGHIASIFGPVVMPNRICVDTSAYSTGNLTAAILVEGQLDGFVVAADLSPNHLIVALGDQPDDVWLEWTMARLKAAGASHLCVVGEAPALMQAAELDGLKANTLNRERGAQVIEENQGHVTVNYSSRKAMGRMNEWRNSHKPRSASADMKN